MSFSDDPNARCQATEQDPCEWVSGRPLVLTGPTWTPELRQAARNQRAANERYHQSCPKKQVERSESVRVIR